MNEESTSTEKKKRLERIVIRITSAASYVFPFVTTLPNLTYWMGIMTMPFIIYLFLMIVNGSVDPFPLPNLTNPVILAITVGVIITIVFLVWSIVHLHRNKSSGLVIGGPYRFVRHPQYLSFIILTGVMTLQSVWILRHTFGIGWLTADQTQIVWIIMLASYVFISKIEETHLEKRFGHEWNEYKERTGYIFPNGKFKSETIAMLTAIIIPYLILQIFFIVFDSIGIILV